MEPHDFTDRLKTFTTDETLIQFHCVKLPSAHFLEIDEVHINEMVLIEYDRLKIDHLLKYDEQLQQPREPDSTALEAQIINTITVPLSKTRRQFFTSLVTDLILVQDDSLHFTLLYQLAYIIHALRRQLVLRNIDGDETRALSIDNPIHNAHKAFILEAVIGKI